MAEGRLPGGMTPPSRDLAGYGRNPPDPQWPGGARLALSFVVNVEEGAELSIASGDERNESIPESGQLIEGAPDPCMESHFAYGSRVALWRILDMLDAYGVKATFSCCGRAVAATPVLAAEPAARGHEVSAHGWRWEMHAGMAEATERAVIAKTVATLAEHAGARPLGWHTKSAPSVNTRRLLLEEGGFLYDSDAYDDDLPHYVTAAGRPHLVIPYTLDNNDMKYAVPPGFGDPDGWERHLTDAFEVLLAEGRAGAPKMMSVGLHCRLVGRPGRAAALQRFLARVAAEKDVWVCRRADIARHWWATHPPSR